MKIRYPTTAEAEATAIRCTLPIRYEEDLEELGADFPGLSGKRLTLTLDIDTATVRDWPAGRTASLHLKVVDEGSYDLLDAAGSVLVRRDGCYVPSCIPSSWGDYVVMSVEEDGRISGWRPCAVDIAADFWPQELL